jgi:hypothetical protein
LRELASNFLEEIDDENEDTEELETDEYEPAKRLFKSKTSGNNNIKIVKKLINNLKINRVTRGIK